MLILLHPSAMPARNLCLLTQILANPIGRWVALLLILVFPVHAQVAGSVDPAFDPDVPSASGGNINGVAVQSDTKIVIVGQFSFIGGQPRRRIARLLADGSLESTATFNTGTGADGEVFCVAVQPDGKILIGGEFTTVDNQPRAGIARLETNGALDLSFDPGLGATGGFGGVRCIAVQTNGYILIGGGFTSVDGVGRNRIARLEDDGDLDLLFDTGLGANNRVNAVAVQADGSILIGGTFSLVNNLSRGRIARLETNGTVESTATFDPGTGADGFVQSIVVQTNGQILIGGSFLSFNGDSRRKFARLNTNGSLESLTTFDPGGGAGGPFGSGSVNSIAVETDGQIVIGGKFDNVDFVARNNIARLNADGSLDTLDKFDPGTGTAGPFGNSDVFSVALQADGKILLGGKFSSVDGNLPGKIARLESNGATDTSTFNPGIVSTSFSAGIVNATAVQPDGRIVIGGQFSGVDGQPAGNIARLNADGTIDSAASIQFGTGTDSDGPIFCVAVQTDGKILIGGQFTSVDRQPRNYLARFLPNGKIESDETFQPAIASPSQVHCIALQADGKILIGGTFATVEGAARSGIARLNANGGLDPSFDPGTGATSTFGRRVYSVAVQADGKILRGGDFDMVHGVARNGIARLESGGLLDAGFDSGDGADGDVNCITVQADGKILIGGTFRNVNNLTRGGIARLADHGGVEDTNAFNSGTGITDGYVSSIALQTDGKIVVGGGFSNVNGQPRAHRTAERKWHGREYGNVRHRDRSR